MKAMKILLRKYGLSVFLILLEVGGIIAFFSFLAHYVSVLWPLAFFTSFIAYLAIVNQDTNPENKIPWISIVLFIPPFGALLYAMFAKRELTQKEIKHIEKLEKAVGTIPSHADEDIISLDDELALGKIQAILNEDTNATVYHNTHTEYFPLGEQMYERMLQDLRSARNFIFMEYFIIEDGLMWGSILEILKKKVSEGVEVRVMYDDIGCAATLDRDYYRVLNRLGIQCRKFNRLTPDASSIHNNRDHRKILVVDGAAGYTGGINLADEYINHIKKHGHWKDGGIRLEGEAVQGLTKLFLLNWDMNSRTISDYEKYSMPPVHTVYGNGCVIPFGSGPKPLYLRQVGKNVYMNLINQARRYVYIMTPYLIIDYDLTEALQNAVMRGVDVRIITPYIPDKKVVQLMTRNNYFPLLQNGVRIYEYMPGFIHSKAVVSDDEYAVVGTINFDYRSLVHHYENAVWMYRADAIADIKADFIRTTELSGEVLPDTIKMNVFQRILRDCIRLFSPLF